MRPSTSTQLVAIAIAQHSRVKDVSAKLERLPPSARAAAVLIDAYRTGKAEPWLVAHLLGCVRSKVGYATVHEILLSAPGGLAENYAVGALTEILKERAIPELCTVLRDAPKRASREAAAFALGHFNSPAAEVALLEAFRAGRIRWETAAAALRNVPIAAWRLTDLFRSGETADLRLAVDIVSTALDSHDRRPTSWVHNGVAQFRPLIRSALANPDLKMSPAKRAHLTAWVSEGS